MSLSCCSIDIRYCDARVEVNVIDNGSAAACTFEQSAGTSGDGNFFSKINLFRLRKIYNLPISAMDTLKSPSNLALNLHENWYLADAIQKPPPSRCDLKLLQSLKCNLI